MGGPNSGNHYHWWRGTKKTTVEACKDLDANRLMREGLLRAGRQTTGYWTWTYEGGGFFVVNFEADTRDPAAASMRLHYSWVWSSTKQQDSASYTVSLTTTQPRLGGLRWWFTCPLVVNGHPCECRVGKLYLPPYGRYFGCRHCHKLTYTSSQTHDPRVSALLRNPAALDAALEVAMDDGTYNTTNTLLALKASSEQLRRMEKFRRRYLT
jgi:hypothetical protein